MKVLPVIQTLCSLKRILSVALILVLPALLAMEAQSQQYEEQKIFHSDPEDYDRFGGTMAIHENLAVIGAEHKYAGAAYIYRYDPVTEKWGEEAKLLAGDGIENDYFGCAVSIYDDCVLIGADHHDYYGSRSGAAYLFRYDPAAGVWNQEAKLLPSDGDSQNYFGRAVCLKGDLALIGAMGNDPEGSQSGAAFIFRHDGAGNWSEEAKLFPSDGIAWDRFGCAVSMVSDLAFIGASGVSDNTGAVYTFRHDGAGAWNQEDKFVASDGVPSDRFGTILSASNDRVLVGVPDAEVSGIKAGAAYLFRYDEGNHSWVQETKLTATGGEYKDHFGASVSLLGDKALIGVPAVYDEGVEKPGSATLFRHESATGSWNEETQLLPSDGMAEDLFGWAVALSANKSLIGSLRITKAGGAYAFDHNYPLHLDITCNGQDNNVLIPSGEEVTLAIEAKANDASGMPVDAWVIVYRIRPAACFAYGYLDSDPFWKRGMSNVYYTGEIADLSETVWDAPLRAGLYDAYLFIETNPNGSFDLGALYAFDTVSFAVMP